MAQTQTIVVTGDKELQEELIKRLPSAGTRVVLCSTVEATTDAAADASVVLVSEKFSGDRGALCRAIKQNPRSANVRILVRCHDADELVDGADEVIPADLYQTVMALRRACPDLTSRRRPLPDFSTPADTKASYERLRRASDSWSSLRSQEDWPHAPPQLPEGVDLLSFARSYAGYINSLVEAYDSPSLLSNEQRVRLKQVANDAVDQNDSLIDQLQKAVNESLRTKNLQRMRDLSSTKNILFDTAQLLRARISRDTVTVSSHASPASTPPADFVTMETLVAEESQPAPEKKKSALTLAAEHRLRRRPSNRRGAAVGRAQRRKARKGHAVFDYRRWVVVLVAALVLMVAWAAFRGSRRQTAARRSTSNSAPEMLSVGVQQTPAGLIVRPSARDSEGDRITFLIEWRVDGQLVQGVQSARLGTQYYKPGQLVIVSVTPSDASGKGQEMVSKPYQVLVLGKALGPTPAAATQDAQP